MIKLDILNVNLKKAYKDDNKKAIQVLEEQISRIKKRELKEEKQLKVIQEKRAKKESKINSMDISKLGKYLNKPGVPIDPEEQSTDTKIVLDRSLLYHMCNMREKFFDVVTLLKPLRESAISSLQELERRGIINSSGKAGGCSSCNRKTLATVLLQLFKHIQTLVLRYREEDKLHALGNQIREVISVDKYRDLVIHLKINNEDSERIEF